jgi:putative inorganic carbon (HCO3(-)) transporter
MNASLGLMMAMVGVSLYATFDIRFSLGKVSGVILGLLLFWAVVRWLTTPERLKIGVAAFLAAGGGLAVVGLLGTDVRPFASSGYGKLSGLAAFAARLPTIIRGVPGAEEGFNPNAVAGCLVLFVPLQIALLGAGVHRSWLPPSTPRSAGRWLFLIQAILLFLTAGTTLLMQSRGAWAGLVVAATAFLIWHGRLIRRRAAAAAVVAVVAVLLTVALAPERLIRAGSSRLGPRMLGDFSVRVQLWSSALHGIRDFPVTGMGMNAFRTIMMARYPIPEITAHYKEVAHAHNHLLQAALDLGIPGLVAYLATWMIAAVLLVQVYRRSREPVYRAMAGGLGTGLIAHFIFGMTDVIPLGSKVGVLFWLTLALTVGLHRVAERVWRLAPPSTGGIVA